MAYVVLLAR